MRQSWDGGELISRICSKVSRSIFLNGEKGEFKYLFLATARERESARISGRNCSAF